MMPLERSAFCVWILGSIFAFELAAQNPSGSNLQSYPDLVAPAVVQLLAVGPGNKGLNQECSATGFLVNEDGYVLTNAHVAEKSQECLAKTPGAKIVARVAISGGARQDDATAPAVSCDVLEVDDVHDLAVLKTERPFRTAASDGRTPFVLLDTGDVTSGTAVKVTGHPAFIWVARTQSGRILGHKSLPLFERSAEHSDVLVLDIPLQRGNSGSPVYLEAGGAVVGIIERQDTTNTSQTLAIPIHYAIDFLNKLGVKWHSVQK